MVYRDLKARGWVHCTLTETFGESLVILLAAMHEEACEKEVELFENYYYKTKVFTRNFDPL